MSCKNGNTRYARLQGANNQDCSPCLACVLHRGSRINLYPVQRLIGPKHNHAPHFPLASNARWRFLFAASLLFGSSSIAPL